jgi:hypothetical protein
MIVENDDKYDTQNQVHNFSKSTLTYIMSSARIRENSRSTISLAVSQSPGVALEHERQTVRDNTVEGDRHWTSTVHVVVVAHQISSVFKWIWGDRRWMHVSTARWHCCVYYVWLKAENPPKIRWRSSLYRRPSLVVDNRIGTEIRLHSDDGDVLRLSGVHCAFYRFGALRHIQ